MRLSLHYDSSLGRRIDYMLFGMVTLGFVTGCTVRGANKEDIEHSWAIG